MNKREEIVKILDNIDKINSDIYKANYGQSFNKVKEILKDIGIIMQDLINFIPTLKECGIDIPAELLMQQLNNLIDAYKNNDSMMLWDTLNYEIKDTFQYYIEIIDEFKKQGVEL